MRNILILLYPFAGPIYASFRVARLLSERGYAIIYLAPPVYREMIRKEGYGFDTLAAEGECDGEDSEVGALKRYHAMLNGVRDADSPLMRKTTKLAEKYDPAGVIVSSDIIGFAIALHARGIPVVLLNDHFLSDKSPGIPPFFSTVIPDGSLWSDWKIEGIWLWWFLRKGFTHFMRKVGTWGAEDGYQKRLAGVCGFAYKRHADFSRTWQYGLKNLPEFFVYPLELDFPHREMRPGYFFAGPMLDPERREEAFDWSMVQDGSKIVLCSLGTAAHLYYPGCIKFLADIIAIFRQRPEYTVIIAAGESYTQLTGYCGVQNVIIQRAVPQLSILRRAVLMINHAGINSVKECILCGVPMMAYPLSMLNDQRGTAARIVYHGLGKRGNIFRDRRDKIAADLNEVLANPVYRQNAAGMKAIFERHQEKEGEHIDRMAAFFHR